MRAHAERLDARYVAEPIKRERLPRAVADMLSTIRQATDPGAEVTVELRVRSDRGAGFRTKLFELRA